MPILYIFKCKKCGTETDKLNTADLPEGWRRVAIWKDGTTASWTDTVLICPTCIANFLQGVS